MLLLALILLSIGVVVIFNSIHVLILDYASAKCGRLHARLTKAKGTSFSASFRDRALNHHKHMSKYIGQ